MQATYEIVNNNTGEVSLAENIIVNEDFVTLSTVTQSGIIGLRFEKGSDNNGAFTIRAVNNNTMQAQAGYVASQPAVEPVNEALIAEQAQEVVASLPDAPLTATEVSMEGAVATPVEKTEFNG